MKSSSIALAKAFGISDPRAYRDAIIHDWYLKQEYNGYLATFKLNICYWPLVLLENIKDGELHCQDHSYSVIWINSPTHIRKSKSVLLSFRYCCILKRGYVLIKEYIANFEDSYIQFLFQDLKNGN